MKQPLRILSVIDIPWNSGLAAYAFDQALALRGAGHSVTFACPEGSAAMRFAAKEGFRALPIPGRKDYFRLPLALLRLRSAARAGGVDVVCAHSGRAQTLGFLLGLPLLRVKADAKKPTAGGITDVIENGANGLTVKPRSPEELAQAQLRLIKDAPLRERLAAEAHRRREDFSSPRMAALTLKCYETAIENFKRNRHPVE